VRKIGATREIAMLTIKQVNEELRKSGKWGPVLFEKDEDGAWTSVRAYAWRRGVSGVWAETQWEVIDDHPSELAAKRAAANLLLEALK